MKPNIIVIVADDLGYGDLSCFGNPIVRTPHIDRLAGDGVLMRQHYSASPLCAPARAGLLTGRQNHRTGAISVESNRGLDRIALDETTLADDLRAAGYATALIGKWHNGHYDRRYQPLSRGFDHFTGFCNGGMGYFDWLIERNGQVERSDGRCLTDVFSDEAIDWIGVHQREPFYLQLAYNAPHSPLEAPDEDVDPILRDNDLNRGVGTLYAMIERMDAGIGRLLDQLEKTGCAENTIVLFTSDNGPWLGSDLCQGERHAMARFNGPFRGMKQDVLEGGIRVPSIIRWPSGLPGGRVDDAMSHFTDWRPTLVAAATAETTSIHPLDGMDILPDLRDETRSAPRKLYWQYNRYDPVRGCNAAVRDGPWKLVWPRIPEAMTKLDADNAPYHELFHRPHFEQPVSNPPVDRELSSPRPPELYNISEDPHENLDLSNRHRERTHKLQRELEDWFDRVTAERASRPET